MGKEAIVRQFIDNRKLLWNLIKKNENYSICDINSEAYFKGCIIKNRGTNNQLLIESGAKVRFCTFSFNGENNIVIIRKNSEINGCVFFLDDNDNRIEIGEGSTFTGRSEFITTEGTSIEIGCDCMFAYGIVLRTGDHHSIIDANDNRVNLSRNIKLGNHVWVGQNACLLKGTEIHDGSVIGACSVVTKGTMEPQSVLAGNPAKVVKIGVRWDRNRI